VADHKVSYKRLAGGVEFVEIIPKNPSGKIVCVLLVLVAIPPKLKGD